MRYLFTINKIIFSIILTITVFGCSTAPKGIDSVHPIKAHVKQTAKHNDKINNETRKLAKEALQDISVPEFKDVPHKERIESNLKEIKFNTELDKAISDEILKTNDYLDSLQIKIDNLKEKIETKEKTITKQGNKIEKLKKDSFWSTKNLFNWMIVISGIGLAASVAVFFLGARKIGISVALASLANLGIFIFLKQYMWVALLIGGGIILTLGVMMAYLFFKYRKSFMDLVFSIDEGKKDLSPEDKDRIFDNDNSIIRSRCDKKTQELIDSESQRIKKFARPNNS